MSGPGALTCRHGLTFDPAKESCAACDSEAQGPEPVELGEGELLCAEAVRRGLPSGFDVEADVVAAWRAARVRADRCVERSDELMAMDSPDAIRWEMAAAKWADTAIKAAKIVAGSVQIRERIAAADRADRIQAEREH